MARAHFSASTAILRHYCCRRLRDVLADKIPITRDRVKYFKKQNGSTKTGAITIDMLYGGMRGIMGLVCETSLVDADEGIRFRGFTIAECKKCLPTASYGEEPLPEGIFWLMLTGEMPSKEQVEQLSSEWAQRALLPRYIQSMLFFMPPKMHPMSQLFMIITALNNESKFVKAYKAGVPKSTYWEYVFEDSMDLIAKLPLIAATIYCNTYCCGQRKLSINHNLDWSANFAEMLGCKEHMFTELLRLYLTIHSDHGGGNVSAHAVHLVGSALSDPYLALAAGVSGLAGPLHGMANQEVLLWLLKLQTALGPQPTKKQLREYVLKTLGAAQTVPGYGHIVLRKTDPRFTCLHEFALKHLPDDELFKLASLLYEIVPEILTQKGMVESSWPNTNALSGVLLYYYGLQELNFYTVIFSVSRALGVLASLIWDRALLLPIEYPTTTSTDMLMKLVPK